MSNQRANILAEARVLGELLAFSREAASERGRAQRSCAVLLIPGLMAPDLTLYPLASRLRSIGHRPFFAGIVCNAGCPRRTMERVESALRRAHLRTARRVVLIGHSLGGLYARELARRNPELVERAILLGAPLRHPIANSTPHLRPLIALGRWAHRECFSEFNARWSDRDFDLPSTPPPVPETIIYSKSDAIVDWRSCLESGPLVEAIEVGSSHCGLPLSPQSWRAITARLDVRPERQAAGGAQELSRPPGSRTRLTPVASHCPAA